MILSRKMSLLDGMWVIRRCVANNCGFAVIRQELHADDYGVHNAAAGDHLHESHQSDRRWTEGTAQQNP